MKRILSLIMIIFIIILSTVTVRAVDDAQTPTFDPSCQGNQGAFFANGTPITIKQTGSNTIIEWDGGSQKVPNTVFVFGGGKDNTSFANSNITMEGGTVGYIFGGGISKEESKPANVTDAIIQINGGTITGGLFGGGVVYSSVDTANIAINDGEIAVVSGGGTAGARIEGQDYSAGSKTDAINSKNRVNNANITINGGKIYSDTQRYGLLYGGGLGYGYTGNTKLVINSGDMSNAYITAGGADGYTGQADVQINGGQINTYGAVYNGTVDKVNFTMKDGTVDNFFAGAMTTPGSATGTINASNTAILGGEVTELGAGTTGGNPLQVDNNTHVVVFLQETVGNDNIEGEDITITYDLKINEENVSLSKGEVKKLTTTITTNPPGYEDIIRLQRLMWDTNNESVVRVDSDGTITAVNTGEATITVCLPYSQYSTIVSVSEAQATGLNGYEIAIIIAIIVILLLILLKCCFCCYCC